MNTDQLLESILSEFKELKQDIKSIKNDLAKIDTGLELNKKDLDHLVLELMSMKSHSKEQNDYLWSEIRKIQTECTSKHKECNTDIDSRISKAVESGNLSIKIWILVSIITALGSIMLTVFSKKLGG
jgi:predicted  nucleic acid-binding Zn-ribbon protein